MNGLKLGIDDKHISIKPLILQKLKLNTLFKIGD